VGGYNIEDNSNNLLIVAIAITNFQIGQISLQSTTSHLKYN